MQEKCLLKKMNNWSLSIWMLVVFLLTGWVLNIVSFAVPYWNNEKPVHWGLWQMCHEAAGCEIISNENLTGMMQTGRVFLTISFVSYVILIILVVLYLFWKNNLRLLSAAAVTSFLTLVGLFLGAILRISDSNTTLSWCYYLCYASAFLASASGGVILHVRRQERLRLAGIQEQQLDIGI